MAVLVYKALHETAFVGHRHVSSAANQHTSWRSLIRCCWTSRMDGTVCQPSCESRTLHSDNFTSTQNASIRSLTAAAPSDSVFRALCTNSLTYLLARSSQQKLSYCLTIFPEVNNWKALKFNEVGPLVVRLFWHYVGLYYFLTTAHQNCSKRLILLINENSRPRPIGERKRTLTSSDTYRAATSTRVYSSKYLTSILLE